MNVGPLLGLVAVLIIVNAALAGSETALVSLREGQLQRLANRGAAGRALASLAGDPNRFLSTIQIGITLAGFLASATAAVSLAEPLVEPLSGLGRAARPVAIFLVTMVLTYVTLVFGELAPKRIALQRAEGWGLVAARPLNVFAKITSPLVWILTKSTDLTVRLFGIDPGRAREEVSQEELRDLVATQSAFTSEQRTIISGAFEIAERSVREILVPRPTVLAFPEGTPSHAAMTTLAELGHSRAPVYRGDLDDVLGIVHLRDLIGVDGTVEEHVRTAAVLPETVGVLDALRQLQNDREQLAIIINEHGGTEGIVTLEDLLEEIVGEIYDEFDRDLDPTDARGVKRLEGGALDLPGSFPMHDLPDVGAALPEGEYATIAGFVLHALGRIPDVGEVAFAPGWRIEVAEREGNAIGRVLLRPMGPEGRQPASTSEDRASTT